MNTERREIGDLGESVAKKFLVRRGFSIMERNYLRPWGEIDIIAKKVNKTHFVEVKTAISHETGFSSSIRPEDNIHPAKWGRIQKAIHTYCLERGISEENIACDAIIVHISSDFQKVKVVFIENIVL